MNRSHHRVIGIVFIMLFSGVIQPFAETTIQTDSASSLVASWASRLLQSADEPTRALRTITSFQTDDLNTFMVPMRDGVRLATYVFLPEGEGPFPAVLARTPYNRDDLAILQILIFAGYAVVIQDVRGRFDSEGIDRGFFDDGWGELQDGYDTVEWIAAQPWSNGKIGTWGPSALGILQELAAGAVPPSLDCQIITFAATQGFGQSAYQNGVFRKSLIEGWMTENNRQHIIPIYRSHPTYDSYWEWFDIEPRHPLIQVPALYIGGWYDCFQEGTLHGFTGRQTRGAVGARGNQKLIMGPWTHVNEFEKLQGELIYPDNSILSWELEESLNWIEYWLKGVENGVMDRPNVRYYVMGDVSDPNAPGNEFRSSDRWPPDTEPVRFYLHSDAALRLSLPTGSYASSAIVVDPSNPVPTIGGFNLEIPAGPRNQAAIEQRGDVLVYSTDPLTEPMQVVGRLQAVLYAAANTTDADITVRLTDVYPDGRSMLVADGVARASFLSSRSDPRPIQPGQIIRHDVDLWSTSLIFNQGHRIRIIVANTNYPRFELNPVYFRLGQDGFPTQGICTIYHSPEYPSHIVLPVMTGPVGITDWNRH